MLSVNALLYSYNVPQTVPLTIKQHTQRDIYIYKHNILFIVTYFGKNSIYDVYTCIFYFFKLYTFKIYVIGRVYVRK